LGKKFEPKTSQETSCYLINHLQLCFLKANQVTGRGRDHLKLTSIYGPTASVHKDDFFEELIAQKPANNEKWLELGEFN
jgi:hypothetical protein